jgi:hypothetical protein
LKQRRENPVVYVGLGLRRCSKPVKTIVLLLEEIFETPFQVVTL